jgi:hypothetical protein
MSNYLQSKCKVFCLTIFLANVILPCQADSPAKKTVYEHTHSTIIEAQPSKGNSWSQGQDCLSQLLKAVNNQPIVKNSLPGREKEQRHGQVQGQEQQQDQLPNALTSIRDKAKELAKNFVYDPNNPGPFFDHLITGYTFLMNVEKNCIPYGEKFLGNKNGMMVSAKQTYAEQTKYLEALKQQRLMLEQNKATSQR